MNRREFLKISAVAAPLTIMAQAPTRKYELLIKGGRVIDPSQSLNTVTDIAINGGKVVAISPDIDSKEAVRTVQAIGQIVTPGLVDLHVHGFEGISQWGINIDQYCVARGVTTAVDAGTCGGDSFDGFRRTVIGPARTR